MNCMMICAVMYGMIESENRLMERSAPPENMFRTLMMPANAPFDAFAESSINDSYGTPGTGIWEPSRYRMTMRSVIPRLSIRSLSLIALPTFSNAIFFFSVSAPSRCVNQVYTICRPMFCLRAKTGEPIDDWDRRSVKTEHDSHREDEADQHSY